MGSRIRENVKHFYECFCEVVPPIDERDAWIIQKYPESYKDDEVIRAVPKFAYPCKFENSVIQHYSFVLTDIESKWTFGFCRHDPKSETALVVLSYLPWHQAFYKLLDNIAVLTHSPKSDDLRDFLTNVYNAKVPDPGTIFKVPFNKGESTFTCECPKQFQLPSIPENRNLTEYYNAIDSHNMMVIFASMLYERRIIFTSKKLTRLSACVQSANDIIYPMIWQHIFVPVLPMALIDYLCAPMPFLIGVPEEVLKLLPRNEIGDVVILDADNNTVETPFDDLSKLPQEVVNSLKKQLRNRSLLLGDGVSRAFLRALVQLIGGYRDALRFQQGEKITFDEDRFIETRHVALQPFLREMLQLQIFQQFIEERLVMLNSGLGFSDEFELEACNYSEKSSSKLKQQYKEWTYTMKKEGSAFFKSVKEKANPAVKSAVKTVKDGGKGMKSAYKGLRSKFRESQGPEQLRNGGDLESPIDKPRSAPNSPTGKRRALGFSVPSTTYRKNSALGFKSSAERSYNPLSPGSTPCSPEPPGDRSSSGTPSLDIPRMDLMHEVQDLLQLRLDTPPIDRSLKPVRSLENFKQSPNSSPESWAFPRTGAPMLHPPNNNQYYPKNTSQLESQKLLQSPDELFSPPPLLPPRKLSKDLFGAMPFVVGGGQNENGDAVFLVASKHSVDTVKLSPPQLSPRRKQEDQEDLIRLDSTSDDIDDFDPLKLDTTIADSPIPRGLSNPLYNYYEPPGLKQNGNQQRPNQSPLKCSRESLRNDQDLLQEYGLDFNNFNKKFVNLNCSDNGMSSSCFDPFSSSSQATQQKPWTKFDEV